MLNGRKECRKHCKYYVCNNPEAVGSNPAPATKKSHPRQNASGLLISTHPSDCNGSGDLSPVQVSAVRCTQIAPDPVHVQ